MTRRHFEALAQILRTVKPSNETSPEYSQWWTDCLAVARACKASNPAFKHETFLAACL